MQDQRLHTLEERCAALAESNARLKANTVDLESCSRRNNIKIIGLPESIEGPRLTVFFSELLVELLGEQTLSSPPELDRAHRALTAKPQLGSRPWPVIIRLHWFQIKEMIIREAHKRRGNIQYCDSPVQIVEDYTPEVLEQCAKYRGSMSTLSNLGLRPSLLFPACLQITLRNGAKKKLFSPEEAATCADNYQQRPDLETN